MRQLINKYGAITAGSILFLALVVYGVTRKSNPGFHQRMVFTIDEESGRESTHVAGIPPYAGSGGKLTVVEVVKYSCEGGKYAFPAYYRKFEQSAHDKLLEIEAADDSSGEHLRADEYRRYLQSGELVRLPAKGSPWVKADSPEGEKVRETPTCHNGQPATVVSPP